VFRLRLLERGRQQLGDQFAERLPVLYLPAPEIAHHGCVDVDGRLVMMR